MNTLKERMSDFEPVVLTPCHTCEHRISGFTCNAFPKPANPCWGTGKDFAVILVCWLAVLTTKKRAARLTALYL